MPKIISLEEHKIPIPDDIAGVDAKWLTEVLSIAHPGLRVCSADIRENIGGACTKLRVALQTTRDDFPPTVVVKGCFEPHSKYMTASQLKEVRYYDTVVPSFGVETVKVMFSQGDADGAAIVMEDLDLRGVTSLDAIHPITSFRLVADFLTEIARIHARWWAAPEVAAAGALGWIQGQETPPRYVAVLQDAEQFADRMARPRAAATPRVLKDPERLLASIHEALANRFGFPLTINHGDLNPSNLYKTADNRPGFLDWTLRRLPWAMDVSYFIVGNLDPVDRRRWEGALLHHYLEGLRRHGVEAPNYDVAWQAYGAWAVWGEIVWLLNRTDFHTEAVCTAMATRFGQAMVDHDTFGVLGV
jgi:hypothetical protein